MKVAPAAEGDGQGDGGLALEEHAYRRIRNALTEGLFAPGDRLSIRRVAAALETSPMPARTALRRLVVEQALDVLPSGTAVVPRLTRKAFTELSALRAKLEPLAVTLAAPRLTRSLYRVLDSTIAGHAAARARTDPAASLRGDREFLFTLYKLADSPMLLGFIESMWLRRGPLFWDARWVLLGHGGAQNRHAEMLAELRSGRPDTAASLLREEIEAAAEFLLKEAQFAGEPQAGAGMAGLSPLVRTKRTPRRPAP